jgi:hypothetical protein
MSTQVGCFCGHANIMTCAFGDFLVAARTNVTLEGFVGLNATNLNVTVETVPN